MSDADNPTDEPNDIHAQIARLQEQVDALMKDRRASTAEDAAPRSEIAVCNAIKTAQQKIEELSERIRGQPLLALLIAAGIGFALGRIR